MSPRFPSRIRDPERLAALRATGFLDAPMDPSLDWLAGFAARSLDAPLAAITLIDDRRQHFKAGFGLTEPVRRERVASVDDAICRYVVSFGRRLIVGDARAHRWLRGKPTVERLEVVAYAGVPLRAASGHTIGSVFVSDRVPRRWSVDTARVLEAFAEVARRELSRRPSDTGGEEGAESGRGPVAELLTIASRSYAMIERAPVGLALLDHGRIVYGNPRFIEIFGVAAAGGSEPLFMGDLVAERDRPRVVGLLDGSDGDGGLRYRVRGRRRDGRSVQVELGGAPVRLEGGMLTATSVVDVTEGAEAEAAIRSSEERFRLIARATNDILWDWDVPTGQVRWNEAAPRIFRYTVAELGNSIEWWCDRVHPEDRERVVVDLHNLVHGAGDVWSSEYRLQRGDGTFATVLDRGYVVRDEKARPLRVVGSMLDITERRRSEEGQRLLARASALLDGSLDATVTLPKVVRSIVPGFAGFCTVDVVVGDELRRAAAVHADPSREGGLAVPPRKLSPDLTGDPIARVLRAREPLLVPLASDRFLGRSQIDPEHRRQFRRLGARSLILVPIMIYDDALGVLTLASTERGRRYGPVDLLIAEDLARRIGLALENARLYRREQDAVRGREEVLGIVSHDLRNPLGTIKLSLEVLETIGIERRTGNAKYLDIIRRSADQMERIITDLLDLSSIDAGRLAIEPRPQEASAILAEVCESFQPLAAGKSVTIQCDPVPEGLHVWLDPHRIVRVFANLIGNALKFTPTGGTITLRADAGSDEVCFSVTDTGPGIQPADLERVFDRYWQAVKGDRRGSGLGLSIARGIVEAHGGRIWVESTLGMGSTFHFSLPTVPSKE